MIKRTLETAVKKLSRKFPVVAVIGPRQSGKTTLLKACFPKKPYVSLENPDTRLFAEQDPRGFLAQFPKGAFFDEIQRTPQLFSYLQTMVDEDPKPGRFILSGSQHFLLSEKISQTLAGRIALLKLLPFSLEELIAGGFLINNPDEVLFNGFYPSIYDRHLKAQEWYPSYLQTYVERDVRSIKNITDMSAFQKFLKLCAGTIGQLMNTSSLATDCGVSHTTIKSWLSVLEQSFIIFFLQPHHRNFRKRLVKMPKLYFYDTGLASYLLGLETQKQLQTHYLRGGLFENFVIAELMKFRVHRGKEPQLYFWRDKAGHEIDCLIDQAGKLFPIEIKAGKTVSSEYFKNLIYFNALSGNSPSHASVITGGDENQARKHGNIVSWKTISATLKKMHFP